MIDARVAAAFRAAGGDPPARRGDAERDPASPAYLATDASWKRGVWTHFEDDGMLSLRALLLPEEGALVQAAIEAAVRVANAERSAAPVAELAADAPPADAAPAVVEDVPDPADEPWAARRADALVAVCEHVLARDGDALLADPGSLPMLVHVDVGVLTRQDLDGRRHVGGGPVLSVATIRRLGCDASIIAVTERDGLP